MEVKSDLALCILWSGIMDWSLGLESWSGVLVWCTRRVKMAEVVNRSVN